MADMELGGHFNEDGMRQGMQSVELETVDRDNTRNAITGLHAWLLVVLNRTGQFHHTHKDNGYCC